MKNEHDEMMLDMVAAYALGAIDATTGECAVVRAHLAQCQTCRDEFRIARAATAALGLSAAQSPPAGLRERIVAALPSQVRPLRAGPSRQAQWFIRAAAAAAVIIAAGLWWTAHRQPAQTWAATCVPTANHCQAHGIVSASDGVLHVQLQGLSALPAGKQYQAWLITPGQAPKPEPAFSPDETGAGAVDMRETAVKGDIVAITIEKSGGAHAPTTKPFVIARLD